MNKFYEGIRRECYVLYAQNNPDVPISDVALALGYDPKNPPPVPPVNQLVLHEIEEEERSTVPATKKITAKKKKLRANSKKSPRR